MLETIRILQVVAVMNRGGLETMIMNYYRNIDRSKVQFDFLVHREFEAEYNHEIRELGGKIHVVPPINPFHHKRYLQQLNDFFSQNHETYKIVHSHYNALSMYPLRAAKKYNIPVRISHSHIANPSISLQTPFFIYTKALLKNYYTHKFACGNKAGEWLFGKDNCKDLKLIPNAIDSQKYIYNEQIRKNIRKELNLNDSDFVIGHVGRFNKSKNHSFLIDVFGEIRKEHKNSKLVLVGGGDTEEKNIVKKVKDMNLENDVIFTGVRDNVYDIMQAFDVFLFPSIFEGLPLVLIEAQAAGLKCIVSTGIPPEAAITNLVQFISLEKSVSFWKDEIMKYISGYKRNDMHSDLVKAGYDIKENAKQLENFYIEEYKKNEK